jgi:hypothetical protein
MLRTWWASDRATKLNTTVIKAVTISHTTVRIFDSTYTISSISRRVENTQQIFRL